jgi:hypothetical protein
MMVVTYLSDFAKEYALGLRGCTDLPRLREFALHWGGLCPDAFESVRRMNDEDWPTFKDGLAKESKGKYAGDTWAERYGDILMPALLLRVDVIAQQFGAPWGTAFLRLEQTGIIQRRGDVYVWVQPKKVL